MPKILLMAGALLAPTLSAHAQHLNHHPAAPAVTASAPAGTATRAQDLPMVNAEVRRVNAGAGTVTLKHGDIPNLDMPPMTMVFQVRDPSQLGPIKVGDQVRFTVDKINGAYTVIDLKPAP